MTNITIEKNIPIPETRGQDSKYPFADMEPGDSFFLPAAEAGKNGQNIRSAVRVWGKRHSRKFTIRTVEGGYRVWRIDGLGDRSLKAVDAA